MWLDIEFLAESEVATSSGGELRRGPDMADEVLSLAVVGSLTLQPRSCRPRVYHISHMAGEDIKDPRA